MNYLHGRVVETVESSDRKAKLVYIARDDGFYEFREEIEVVDDETEWGLGVSTYWMEGQLSGLYQTFELARADAGRLILWLRDTN